MGVLGHKQQHVQHCITITSQEYMSYKRRYFGADIKEFRLGCHYSNSSYDQRTDIRLLFLPSHKCQHSTFQH